MLTIPPPTLKKMSTKRRRGKRKTPPSKRKPPFRKVLRDLKGVVITSWFLMNVGALIGMLFLGRLPWGLLWNRKGYEEDDDEGYGHGYGDNKVDVTKVDLIFMCIYGIAIWVVSYCIWRLPYFLYFRNVKSLVLPLNILWNWITDIGRRVKKIIVSDIYETLFSRVNESWNRWTRKKNIKKKKKKKKKQSQS